MSANAEIAIMTPLPMLEVIWRLFICAGLGGSGVEVDGTGVIVDVDVTVGAIVSSGAGVEVGRGVLVSMGE